MTGCDEYTALVGSAFAFTGGLAVTADEDAAGALLGALVFASTLLLSSCGTEVPRDELVVVAGSSVLSAWPSRFSISSKKASRSSSGASSAIVVMCVCVLGMRSREVLGSPLRSSQKGVAVRRTKN
jgi:hypothetical protein